MPIILTQGSRLGADEAKTTVLERYKNEFCCGSFHRKIEAEASYSDELLAIKNFIERGQRDEQQNVDVLVIDFTNTGDQARHQVIIDIDTLLESAKESSLKKYAARLYIVENISASVMEVLGSALDCDVRFFNDHLQRASDDTAILLPSNSQHRSYMVVPYRRTYKHDSKVKAENMRSFFAHAPLAATEEHASLWASLPLRNVEENGSWTGILLCDPKPLQAVKKNASIRPSLKALISRDEVKIRGHPHAIIYTLLKITSDDWARVVRDQEAYMSSQRTSQYTGATDSLLLQKESFGEYLKQNLDMLDANIQIIQFLQSGDLDMDELLVDFKYLLAKTDAQIRQNGSSIPVITAMIAVEESRKAIQQANDVKALTTLATIYIPLSYVAGVFGMNVTQFGSSTDVPIWMYFVIAIPITALSLLLVIKWSLLLEITVLIFQLFIEPPKRLMARWNSPSIPEGTIARAAAVAGLIGTAQSGIDNEALVPEVCIKAEKKGEKAIASINVEDASDNIATKVGFQRLKELLVPTAMSVNG